MAIFQHKIEKRWWIIFTVIFFLFAIALVLDLNRATSNFKIPFQLPVNLENSQSQTEEKLPIGENSQIQVLRVIDGDTIELQDGTKVRYIGINTPETVSPSKPIECFGKEASEKNKELVEGKMVRLEKDISETDKYGRLLRYVFVGDLFVNEYLAREGYAYASTYPPDVKYQTLFQQAEEEAKENKKGLWNNCPSPTH